MMHGRGYAQIALVAQQPDIRRASAKVFNYIYAAVGRAVINDNYFQWVERLVHYCLENLNQITRGVIAGNDY